MTADFAYIFKFVNNDIGLLIGLFGFKLCLKLNGCMHICNARN